MSELDPQVLEEAFLQAIELARQDRDSPNPNPEALGYQLGGVLSEAGLTEIEVIGFAQHIIAKVALEPEMERLKAIEAAAIEWKQARDKAFKERTSNLGANPIPIMAPVGKALDKLASLLP